MPLTTWNRELECGNITIDAQHRGLFQMVNHLHDQIVAGKGKDVLGPTLKKLTRYTVEHFQTEEKLMLSMGYPNLAEHKQKHDNLAAQAQQLLDQMERGEVLLSMTVSRFLADWVKHHIQEEDQKMIEWMRVHLPQSNQSTYLSKI